MDEWIESALTSDSLVVELLLDIKHSSTKSPPTATAILPPLWGNRKNRSKSIAVKEHRRSPTTHLSWSGGAASTSDGCDRSDLDSGSRSVKANEGASTSSHNNNKSHKRKSFIELKDEEGSLLKERIHVNKELTSTRVTMNQQMTSQNLKKIKVNLGDQNPRNKMERKAVSCKVEAETESMQRGFVLPDLNMIPNDEDLVMLS